MKTQPPILTLLVLLTMPLPAAETAALPEPGPEDGGLRMRLVVAPRTNTGKEGYQVRVDLLNTSERAITLHTAWKNDEAGDLKDYIDAATSIECVPAVQRWMGQVTQGRRKAAQPEHVLKPGQVLSVRWQTEGRRLKNRVTDPLDVQNPELPLPGLYSIHATVSVIADGRTVPLRSNEQLVSVGGSRAMPKSTFGQLFQVEAEGRTALLSLGSMQKIEPGDLFEYNTMAGHGRLTVTTVKPTCSIGKLEVLSPTNKTPQLDGMGVTLVQRK